MSIIPIILKEELRITTRKIPILNIENWLNVSFINSNKLIFILPKPSILSKASNWIC